MIRLALACLLATGVIWPSVANAAEKEVRQLKSKHMVDLATGKAYIMYDTVEYKYDIYFLRSLTDEEMAGFEESREVSIGEARAKLRERRDGAPGISDEELLPSSSFRFSDDNINNLVRMDSGRVYSKDGKIRTYLVEVPVGEYTIYAAGIDGFTGGTCMCMGTVKFDAEAGQVTDLGAIMVAPESGKTDISELQAFEAPEYIRRKALPYIMTVRAAKAGDPVPEAIAGLPTELADYRASEKISNFMGMLINRMPPIDGVLDYDRDVPIDVKALAEADAAAAAAEIIEATAEATAEAVEDAAETLEDGIEAGAEEAATESPELAE